MALFKYSKIRRRLREVTWCIKVSSAYQRPTVNSPIALDKLKVSIPNATIGDFFFFCKPRDTGWQGHRFSREGINGWSWVTSPSPYASNGATDVKAVWSEWRGNSFDVFQAGSASQPAFPTPAPNPTASHPWNQSGGTTAVGAQVLCWFLRKFVNVFFFHI